MGRILTIRRRQTHEIDGHSYCHAAGLGPLAMTLPAAAAPATLGGTDVSGAVEPALVQLAQLNPRQINEARGGDLKKKAKKKKKK